MFYVANMSETVEDVTLGWFWMCRMDCHVEARINTNTMKVKSLILIGEECIKEPTKALDVLPSQEA